MIELRGAGKEYGQAIALHPTDLAVEPGKTTVLIGPSGCGKSTILRMVVGLIEPTAGQVLFDGTPVGENILGQRRRMGYVIQEGGLFPHLTARDNILLMGKYLGRSSIDMQIRLRELCELTHLPESALASYPVELSGGQRQRVSLMRALMLEPEVLLLDEPLGALDPLVRYSLQTDLKEVFGKLGQTVLMVTHDMAEAAFFADRIVLLMEGRIVQEGTIEDLRDRPASPDVTAFMTAQRSLVLI